MKRVLLILSCLVLYASVAVGQLGSAQKKPGGDPRVRAALDEIGYKYEIDEGLFKLAPLQTEPVASMNEGKGGYRTQLVYVGSTTQKYASLEIREVWSPAFFSLGPPSATIANRLLRENDSVKLGAWRVQVEAATGKYLGVFAVQIAADSDAEALRLAIKSVVLVADRMEKELTGKDDY